MKNYPDRFEDTDAWALEAGRSSEDSRARFVQYTVLFAVGSVRRLRDALVFKGGNALDFVWMANRSTTDLDFSLDSQAGIKNSDVDQIAEFLKAGLQASQNRFSLHFGKTRLERIVISLRIESESDTRCPIKRRSCNALHEDCQAPKHFRWISVSTNPYATTDFKRLMIP